VAARRRGNGTSEGTGNVKGPDTSPKQCSAPELGTRRSVTSGRAECRPSFPPFPVLRQKVESAPQPRALFARNYGRVRGEEPVGMEAHVRQNEGGKVVEGAALR